jgi:anti-sigma B factor antagonist
VSARSRLSITVVAGPKDAWSVRLGGELDAATRDEVAAALFPIVAVTGDVTLDLADLSFCDSSGLALIVALAQKASTHDARIEILHPQPIVQRVLEIAGIDWLVELH